MKGDKLPVAVFVAAAMIVTGGAAFAGDPLSSLLKGVVKAAGVAVGATGEAVEGAAAVTVEAGKVAVGASGEAAEVSVGAGKVAVGATGKLLGLGGKGKQGGRHPAWEAVETGSAREHVRQPTVPEVWESPPQTPDVTRSPFSSAALAPQVKEVRDLAQELEQRITTDTKAGKITGSQAASLRSELKAILSHFQAVAQPGDKEAEQVLKALERVEDRLERYLITNARAR